MSSSRSGDDRPETSDDSLPEAPDRRGRSANAYRPDDQTISGLYSAYVSSHATLSFDQFRTKLLKGVAVWEDLDLLLAERVLPQLRALRATKTSDEGPIRTRELQQLLDELLSLTLEDGLTGLFNRRYFDHRLGQELLRARREQTHCSVMLVDIDDFKRINDTYGHDVGDRLLQHVSAVLRGTLRASDEITARVGGEEFAIILPNTGVEQAPIVAERMRARIRSVPIDEPTVDPIKISISVGVATATPSIVMPAADLVKRADIALYQAKHSGKDAVRSFAGDHHGGAAGVGDNTDGS